MSYQPGDIFLNKYHVKSLVGQGAFGEVYHVTHLRLSAPRAAKLLRRDSPGIGSQDFQKARERFEFEAQLGARLDHPNVIRVYDFEEDAGELILVMEYAPGGSLRDQLDLEVSLSVEEVVNLGLDLCVGMQTIHERLRAVHRDIKPSNILFDEDGTAKIADLGLAQVPDDTSRRSLLGSLAGSHPGSPMYMSPEQEISRGLLLPSSDVFSLGCVLFEALTGLSYKKEYGSRVRDHRPEIPQWLDEIITRALAEQPGRVPADDEDINKRYRKVEYLQKALRQGWKKEAGKPDGQEKSEKLRAIFERIPRWGWALGIGILLVMVIGYLLWGNETLVSKATPTVYSEAAAIETEPTSTSTTTTAPTSTRTPTKTTAITITPSPTQTVPPTVTYTPIFTSTPMAGATQISAMDGMVMVYVPAGDYSIGAVKNDLLARPDESPQHSVYLRSFWIDQNEVTNTMYASFLNEQGNKSEGGNPGFDSSDEDVLIWFYGGEWIPKKGYENHPVIEITWYGASAYCEWVGRRLPVEAEWEISARGPQGLIFPYGNRFDSSVANVDDETFLSEERVDCGSSGCDGFSRTSQVGSFPQGVSPYGLFDMSGNVWEWVMDWFEAYPGGDPNAHEKFGQTYRVMRGGGWLAVAEFARTSYREISFPYDSYADVGFRCAVDDEP